MKKKVFAVCALALSTVICAGCKPHIVEKPKDEYEVNLDIDRNIQETLTLLIPSNDGDLEKNYIDALSAGFKEKFPNVTIKLDRRAISDEKYAEAVSSAIASGNIPDLFYTNTAFYYYLIAKNCVVSLEPYYKASEEAGVFNIEADFYSSFFDMSMYEDKRYVVPRSMDSVVTYYNTEILSAAGIDVKTDARFSNSWTWENLVSVCKEVSDYILSDEGRAAGYGDCYALQPEFDWEAVFNAIMLSYGVKVFDEQGNVAIDSPETREMSEMIRELKSQGRILRDSDSRSTFDNGKVAFTFSSLGPLRMNLKQQIAGKFDALPFPLIGDNPRIGSGFAGYGISSATTGAKRDLAWQFLNYMISEEGQMTLINGGLATPSIRVDLAEEKQWAKGASGLNLDAWLVGEQYKVASNFFTSQNPSCTFDILSALQSFMKGIADSTNKSIEICVRTCAEELREAIAG